VTRFFEYIPVRKQTATKNSAKYLAKIRHLMQAYALARPTIRFRFRVLKAKNNNGDFVYAPKSDANIEDAVLKVIEKDCALQCDWTTLEANGFEIHAFLPKPTASGPKIANQGAFVSVDARPVSSSRGTTKQMITAFKDRLRKSNPSLAGVKDPFFCMNIICPPDSYDPNIEPAKDDVMFDNGDVVLGVMDKLLKSYYPEAVVQAEELEQPMSVEQAYEPQPKELAARSQTPPLPFYEDDDPTAPGEQSLHKTPSEQPRWRYSMYGIEEDNLEFLQDIQAPVIKEEEGLRAAEVSNPWTIARMNTAIKPKQPANNGQLLSPAKSQTGTTPLPSSPAPTTTPNKPSPMGTFTPQTSSRTNMVRSPLDDELEHSIQRLPPSSLERSTFDDGSIERSALQDHEQFSIPPSESGTSTHFVEANLQRPESRLPQFSQFHPMPHEMPPSARAAPHRDQRKQQAFNNKPFTQPARQSHDTSFGQPMSGVQPSQPPRRQKRAKNPEVPLFPDDDSLVQNSLYSKDNTDICSFFGRDKQPQRSQYNQGSSFTPINPHSQFSHSGDRLSVVASIVQQSLLGHSRASSAEPKPCSKRVRDQLLLNDDRALSAEPHDMAEQFRAYAEREEPARASSAGSEMSMLFKDRSTGINDAMHMHSDNGARPEPHNIARQSQAYHNSFAPSLIPRPSSVGSERPSQIPQRSSQVATTLARHRVDQPSQNAKEMEAYFLAHENNTTPFSAQPATRTEPRIAPSHEKHPRRIRRTTDGLERSKSSKLPLQRIPRGFHIQDLVLHLPISLQRIVKSARKLDMRSNTPEWGYAAEDAAEVFAEPVTERKIMDWVIKLDGMLYEMYERVGGTDTRCELHEGIQRALDARKEVEEAMGGIVRQDRGAGGGVAKTFDDGGVVQVEDGGAAGGSVKHPAVEERKADEEMFDEDFDVSSLWT
jgi:DNA mismatch repair ATPase MutL